MLDKNTHKAIMVQILKDIYADVSLGPLLGFKGGTAAFLFYGLSRFSVDLDFDLLDGGKADRVYEKIGDVAAGFGRIKEKYDKEHTVFFLLSYADKDYNIKIEVNKRKFGSSYEHRNYLGIPMLVMVKRDMFAHKLVAMTERRKSANRDIFDVWFFLKNNWDINREIVERRTGIGFKDYLGRCIKFVAAANKKNILSGMGELFGDGEKDRIKEKLLADTLFLLKLRLENES